MPHQCVKCGAIYKDGSKDIVKGCMECGAKLFFFIKKERLSEVKEVTLKLTKKEKKEIENDVLEIVGNQEQDKPIILDFESIKVVEPGKYELDVVNLFNNKPVVYKLEQGKYIIDLPESFKKLMK